MKRSSFFAAVGLNLSHHHRVLRIKRDDNRRVAAIGTWLVALLYTRREELDGFVPADEVEHLATADVIRDLVEVGLFSAEEKDGVHGFRVLKYEVWNETKRDVEKRLYGDRVRKKDKPKARKVQPDSVRNPGGQVWNSEKRDAVVPDGDSNLVNDAQSSTALLSGTSKIGSVHNLLETQDNVSRISGRNPDGIQNFPVGIPPTETETETETQRERSRANPGLMLAATRAPEPMPVAGDERNVGVSDTITPELRATAEMATVQDITGAWAKFCGHYAGKWVHVPGKWQMWCVNEAKRERIDRDRARENGQRSAQAAPGTISGNPYDGPVQRAERARRKADQERTRRDAVPIPMSLLAVVGELPTEPEPMAEERPSETRRKSSPPIAMPREMTEEELVAKRQADLARLRELEEESAKVAS